jgi:hypothetical protein
MIKTCHLSSFVLYLRYICSEAYVLKIRIGQTAFLIFFLFESICILFLRAKLCGILFKEFFSHIVTIICDAIIVYSIVTLSVLFCSDKGCNCVRELMILGWILCRVVSNWYSMITFELLVMNNWSFYSNTLFSIVWTMLFYQINMKITVYSTSIRNLYTMLEK